MDKQQLIVLVLSKSVEGETTKLPYKITEGRVENDS